MSVFTGEGASTSSSSSMKGLAGVTAGIVGVVGGSESLITCPGKSGEGWESRHSMNLMWKDWMTLLEAWW